MFFIPVFAVAGGALLLGLGCIGGVGIFGGACFSRNPMKKNFK
jgi:hypothetical protein